MSKLVSKSKKTTGVKDTEVKVVPQEVEDNKAIIGTEDEDLEIIEVSQKEVKEALKALLTKQNSIIAMLYEKHDEYNKTYFSGLLSVPLITVEKMSNKTLGAYNHGTDNAGLENHIYMNKNFIALNTETRILETLRHEMIHQYQDEVMYEKFDKQGVQLHTGVKRPSEWHNKDFKEYAEKVGIPANGKNCTGNPAHMPEAKSYNRKFRCACIASNGYPMTIWSTREVNATCNICGKPYVEVKKSGGTIAVSQSSIERPGEDAIEKQMLETFSNFERYAEKAELTASLKLIKQVSKGKYKEGIYQKGHNAYALGYRYWVAWQVTENLAKKVAEEELKKQEELKKAEAKQKAEEAKNAEEAKKAEEAKRKIEEALAKQEEERIKKELEEAKKRAHLDEDPDIVPPKKFRNQAKKNTKDDLIDEMKQIAQGITNTVINTVEPASEVTKKKPGRPKKTEVETTPTEPKKRGRKPGSKNKTKGAEDNE